MKSKLLIGAFLGLLGGYIWAACDSSTPATVTSKFGLYEPVINACGWGTTTNTNWSIVDSSAPCLACNNVFTGNQTFNSGAIALKYPSILYFQNSSGGNGAYLANPVGLGLSALTIAAPDGLGINSDSPFTTIGLFVNPGNFQTYGSMAVDGTLGSGGAAYQGFIGTAPVTTSTLWSLPVADGTNGQIIKTDGSAHLGFTSSLSTTTFTGGVNLWNLPIATINTLTASATGQMLFCTNCAANGAKGTICVSTGSMTTFQFVLSTGTRCL